MFRVLALDPGQTTGWATYTAMPMLNTDNEIEYYDEKWAQGQLGPGEHHDALNTFLGLQRVAAYVIVCESFEFRNIPGEHRDNINLMSREYIGVVKRFAQEELLKLREPNVFRLVFQTAATAKGFIPDKGATANKKIKDAGLWWPNSPHAMDATRHLLYYLVNHEGRYDLVRRFWHK